MAKFIVVSADDKNEYHERFFKTFGGARRWYKRNSWFLKLHRKRQYWAIERVDYENHNRSAVLAQSKDYPHKTRFVNRERIS